MLFLAERRGCHITAKKCNVLFESSQMTFIDYFASGPKFQLTSVLDDFYKTDILLEVNKICCTIQSFNLSVFYYKILGPLCLINFKEC